MKKVIGILLTFFGIVAIFLALFFGLVFGGLGYGFDSVKKTDADYDMDYYSTCVGRIVSSYGGGDVSSGDNSKTTVSYVVDDIEYVGDLHIYNSQYVEGDTVTVYYKRSNPNHFEVPELTEGVFNVLSTIFSGFGIGFLILFGVIGLIMLIVGIIFVVTSKKVVMPNGL